MYPTVTTDADLSSVYVSRDARLLGIMNQSGFLQSDSHVDSYTDSYTDAHADLLPHSQPGFLTASDSIIDQKSSILSISVAESTGLHPSIDIDSGLDHLKQIDLLNLKLKDQTALASQKYNSYQNQISTLQSLLKDSKKTVDVEDTPALTQLNTDLLAQVSHLRTQLSLTHREDTDTSLSLSRHIPSEIRAQVDRILNPDTMVGRSFQNSTDDEERCKLELEVERLKAEVKSLKGDVKGLTTEREQIMSQFNKGLKHEFETLSTKYTALSNDAEVALSAERVASLTIRKQDRVIRECNVRIDAMTVKYDGLCKEYEEIGEKYLVLRTVHETLEKHLEGKVDPIVFIETQWRADRITFYNTTATLTASVHFLESENKDLRKVVAEMTVERPDSVAYAEMVGLYSVSKDEVARMERVCEVREGAVLALQAGCLKLDTLLKVKTKQWKDLGLQLSSSKRDGLRKETMIAELRSKIGVVEERIARVEGRSKVDAGLVFAKESLLKEFKAKVRVMEANEAKVSGDVCGLDKLHEALKEFKLDAARKGELVKHWKKRAGDLVAETKKLHEDGKEKVDGKQLVLLQAQLRSVKEKYGTSEECIKRLRRREQTFCNVFRRVLLASDGSGNYTATDMLDEKQREMAEKLSKEVQERLMVDT